ncbi:MAG: TraR/DksA family transcriptional regulator [Gemmatimonadota bacterium]
MQDDDEGTPPAAGKGAGHLSGAQLEELREELVHELRELERSMEVTDEGLKPVELDPGAVGRLSRIDELQNQALTRNLREREQIKLNALLRALGRLEAGEYGLCTECGGPISFERLQVFPETPTCMGCSA